MSEREDEALSPLGVLPRYRHRRFGGGVPMTLDQFLAQFREEAPKHRWELWANVVDGPSPCGGVGNPKHGRIRSECGCPIETLTGKPLGRALQSLDLGGVSSQIVDAADYAECHLSGYLMGNHARIRRELLRATGLEAT